MQAPRYPSLYQINTRVWLTGLAQQLGRPATLDDIPDAELDWLIGELQKIAAQCDGVRCDMAMLVLPDVFERTWGRRAPLFWPRATAQVRESGLYLDVPPRQVAVFTFTQGD